ncbi:hypothetical protein QYE76_039536 [Lolium multiflorum]|uniref:DUF4216 domain-containing protein n=1 Tax=Lolium multiflorum TaxID=4521 RepID=A0AAD8TB34_LOLMU|nr:hypothetical protein QYE76_039536 [Lolium multiflorum]
MMEDGDEEEDNDDQYRSMFSECNDTAMDDNEEEGGEEQASDDPVDDDLRRAISDARRDCGTDKERLQFDKMLEDHHKLLYPGCEDGHRKLGSILELLKWKAEVGVTDSGFEKLMIILKKLFPRNNELPVSTYEAKKLVCPLGLDVQKIHACINDCILYRGEKYENLNKCPICGALRYKIRKDDPGDVEGEPPRKRVPAKVMWLPSSNICTFQGYEINGNTFYTIDQDKKSTNQNSGVRFDATDENGQTTTYYGYIEEIWELDYGPTFKVPLFRCKWVKLSGIHIDDKYGMITVDPNNLAYLDEPFVLASEVAQARHRFYFVLFLRQGVVRYMLYLIEQCVHRRILILPTALVPVATNHDKSGGNHPDYSPTWDSFFINRRERAVARYEEDGPPSSNFNEAGRRMWWRGRTLQSVMAYRGPRLRYPQSQPTRGHPPRFDNRDPDGSDDDVGDYDDYSGEYYRTRHDYD